MPKRILRGALPTVVTTAVTILAAACALPRAHADIYTWTDESGRVNISNLAPPEGARVTKVAVETAGKPVARDEAREALREAEVRLLAERVRQLQNDVELAKRPAPAPVEYRAVQPAPVAPPIIQYITLEAPQYPAPAPQPVELRMQLRLAGLHVRVVSGFLPLPRERLRAAPSPRSGPPGPPGPTRPPGSARRTSAPPHRAVVADSRARRSRILRPQTGAFKRGANRAARAIYVNAFP